MRALIVDDERLARNELKRLLEAHPEVTVVAEAANADEARAELDAHAPDLVFLDIQMPGQSGFELLESLDTVPPVIFTTAYDAYALRAFEVSALDYLMKPIEPERLARAVERALSQPAGAGAPAPGGAVLGPTDRVFVRDGERYWFVALGDVQLFESEGNYTRLYFGRERPLVYRSLNYLEARLDPAAFFRASRRHLLNLKRIASLAPWFNGGMLVRLEDGHEVQMSRRRAQAFRDLMSL